MGWAYGNGVLPMDMTAELSWWLTYLIMPAKSHTVDCDFSFKRVAEWSMSCFSLNEPDTCSKRFNVAALHGVHLRWRRGACFARRTLWTWTYLRTWWAVGSWCCNVWGRLSAQQYWCLAAIAGSRQSDLESDQEALCTLIVISVEVSE